jgi:hypothetical protein
MLDIPVIENKNRQSDSNIKSNVASKAIIESLHVLFSLYSEFKNNQHFQREHSKKIEANVHSEKYY